MSTNRLEQCRAKYLRDEGAVIRLALESHDWIQTEAAKWLRCPVTSLARAIRRHPKIAKVITRRPRR